MIKKYKISPLSYFTFENGEMELTNAVESMCANCVLSTTF